MGVGGLEVRGDGRRGAVVVGTGKAVGGGAGTVIEDDDGGWWGLKDESGASTQSIMLS